ncbi:hypothetical protein HMI54_000279 [Coelomomyces lativittatus]|nr:hypothetical protein HMI56_007715 [Coelomomyces lativittatus]KAJ1512114.1 hypothetical protein HMI54_000279 [Coelomomyces lativittatus]
MLLTIAAKRMSKQNVLVKDLPCVETLGAITLLATDKTGTLTRNQMTVAYVWTEHKMFSVLSEGQHLKSDETAFDSNVFGIQDVLKISAMCSRARFDHLDVPIDQRQIVGDATETGLFRLATQKLTQFDQLTEKYPKVFEIPFNSDTKWHLTIHQMQHANGVFTLFIKGAPERVLRICDTMLSSQGQGHIVSLTEEDKVAFNNSYEKMAGKGHRVLAFAKLELPSSTYPENYVFNKEDKNYPTSGLTFVGLASLEDPPKHGVREAIGNCRRAGIKVVMVTGDHPLTAEAIGRKINLMISDTKPLLAKKQNVSESQIQEEDVKAIVIHGEKIDQLTEEDWDMIFAKDEIIFARTSPKHKLQIVKKAQSLGHIVGVTGDGVNDSPALKKADLGIAMNLSGSDVSKEAASMILLDDNFASIINGIKEGRLIFANLKKAIQYVVSHIIPEVIPQLLFVVANVPLGLGALQILVIDLGFELFNSLSFAYELPEGEALMKLMPRKPVDRESILYLRERRQFDLRFIRRDEEEGEEKTRDLVWKEKLKRLFCKEYWKKWLFKSEKGEVLVDLNILMWAYVEAGLIEYIGCQVAFFSVLYSKYGMTPTQAVQCQKNNGFTTDAEGLCPGFKYATLKGALASAQSIFYLSVMIIQIFNLFACKCLMTSPLRLYIFKNRKTWYSIFSGFVFAVLIVYLPFLNEAFSTNYYLDVYYLFIPVLFGLFLYFYSVLRFYIKKRFKPITFTPEPLGLQMHPTRWSRN